MINSPTRRTRAKRRGSQFIANEVGPCTLPACFQTPTSPLPTFAELAALVEAQGKENTELEGRDQAAEEQMAGIARATRSGNSEARPSNCTRTGYRSTSC